MLVIKAPQDIDEPFFVRFLLAQAQSKLFKCLFLNVGQISSVLLLSDGYYDELLYRFNIRRIWASSASLDLRDSGTVNLSSLDFKHEINRAYRALH